MKEVPDSYVISSTNVAYVAQAAGEHAVQGHKEKSGMHLICVIHKTIHEFNIKYQIN